jgi:hypothetical protein
MTVENTLGAGGICLFDTPGDPDAVSRARFTPHIGDKITRHNFNYGQISDTRYAFEVLTNGPQRAMIQVKTLNWDTGNGYYAVEQVYTAYANQSYCTCKVRFTDFQPLVSDVAFGAGIRRLRKEDEFIHKGGTIMSMGPAVIENPDDDMGLMARPIEFLGTAIVVKDKYNPQYVLVEERGPNHVLRVPFNEDLSYEYLLAGAWSESFILNNRDEFKHYVLEAAEGFNGPIELIQVVVEKKGNQSR